MLTKSFSIKNKYGIHARPAGQLVKTATKYNSQVFISKNGNEVNAKSIMGVLMLEAGYGSEVVVKVVGGDEENAMNAVEDLIVNRKFDEE